MKDEAELNLIVKQAIIADGKGWASKIPDPSSDYAKTVQRPFDGLAILPNGTPVYWEGKFLNKMESFNLQDIKDHQIENLCCIKELNPNLECWIVLGVKVGRGDNRVFIFSDPFKIRDRRLAKNNYYAKELLTLPYEKVFKGAITLSADKITN